MKTVLCFGDSNTWGQKPLRSRVKERFGPDVRWTGRLQALAGPGYRIIEEGNNGRTTGLEDPARPGRNGLAYLAPCLDSHVPLDLVIFMLGTNDLKSKFAPTPESIAERMRALVRATRAICSEDPGRSAEILVISPPIIRPEHYEPGDFSYPAAERHSRALAPRYSRMCAEESLHFLDAALHVDTSTEDGAHFDAANHARLAQAVWDRVKALLP